MCSQMAHLQQSDEPTIANVFQYIRQLPQDIQREAELFLLYVINQGAAYLRTWPQKTISQPHYVAWLSGVQRLQAGEPLAYITGQQAFWKYDFKVNTHTLIPRPDTEVLLEQALALNLCPNAAVVDLGTGSGILAICLKKEKPQWQVSAVDFSENALIMAQVNAQQLQAEVQFYKGSWFEPVVGQQFDLIVSNPPYIHPQDSHLADLSYEPITALVAQNQGMADIEHICLMSPKYLKQGGYLLLEHGYDQAAAVQQCFVQAGFKQVKTVQDYGSNDRVTMGQYLP